MAGVAALVAVVVATTVAIMVFAFPASINSPPNVKFVEFTSDRKQDIKVGESLKVFFNVVRTMSPGHSMMSGSSYLSSHHLLINHIS